MSHFFCCMVWHGESEDCESPRGSACSALTWTADRTEEVNRFRIGFGSVEKTELNRATGVLTV